MMNFGERSYYNIPHNFGIQRVTRFQPLPAQKSPLLSFVLLFGQQPYLRLKLHNSLGEDARLLKTVSARASQDFKQVG
jgi:hypothetical protein